MGDVFSAVEEWHRPYEQKRYVLDIILLLLPPLWKAPHMACSFVGLPPIMESIIIEVISVAITTDSLRSGRFLDRDKVQARESSVHLECH